MRVDLSYVILFNGNLSSCAWSWSAIDSETHENSEQSVLGSRLDTYSAVKIGWNRIHDSWAYMIIVLGCGHRWIWNAGGTMVPV